MDCKCLYKKQLKTVKDTPAKTQYMNSVLDFEKSRVFLSSHFIDMYWVTFNRLNSIFRHVT